MLSGNVPSMGNVKSIETEASHSVNYCFTELFKAIKSFGYNS